ncbi:MAG TPA: squalene synthase HpnC [Burkholderiaceae bacterium]|nr:squalene synthase HpnC [Burkholderiaceae bacterium]
MSVGHYENFPVASCLMPARFRPAVRAIYRFARTADDLADEGVAAPAERLSALDGLRKQLRAIELAAPSDWSDLAAAVREHQLQLPLFHDLLSAFSQDVVTVRYESFEQLTDYCRRSANPVGRLLLQLFRRSETQLLQQSDAICTGLQLANFWQDVGIDWDKGRVYLPQIDLSRFGVSEVQIARGTADQRWQSLMRFEVQRTRELLQRGAPLARALGGRIGLELRLVVQGGLRILEQIDAVNGDVFSHRPKLSARDWTLMGWRALQPLPT